MYSSQPEQLYMAPLRMEKNTTVLVPSAGLRERVSGEWRQLYRCL